MTTRTGTSCVCNVILCGAGRDGNVRLTDLPGISILALGRCANVVSPLKSTRRPELKSWCRRKCFGRKAPSSVIRLISFHINISVTVRCGAWPVEVRLGSDTGYQVCNPKYRSVDAERLRTFAPLNVDPLEPMYSSPLRTSNHCNMLRAQRETLYTFFNDVCSFSILLFCGLHNGLKKLLKFFKNTHYLVTNIPHNMVILGFNKQT